MRRSELLSPDLNTKEYKQLVDQLGYGKRLPGALDILDPGDASELVPSAPGGGMLQLADPRDPHKSAAAIANISTKALSFLIPSPGFALSASQSCAASVATASLR